ncbi:FG-GAP repeat protein [Arundinibacter roseus]|uniref:PKD domain-containing protein n=1 Tax=Arundinibacter roseus TaxID=2070510 RepID=A0A4V2XAF2_9BACT|nr:FG-GAP repeat protein [Arundinibacter roseus]TDB67415.1 hypothetical protein EZE20_05575 [Arundinibacter roseus]
MIRTLCSLFLILIVFSKSVAQIGIGAMPHPSAALDLNATDKAFYPPRVTTAQRIAIENPQAGAFVYDTDKGRMYLYDGQNWYPLTIETNGAHPLLDRFASDRTQQEYFGRSVAIDGNYAIIGAIGNPLNKGNAYIFVREGNTWIEQAVISLSDGQNYDNFGMSVSISGGSVVVGASSKTVIGDNNALNYNQGVAVVFVRSGATWTQQAVLSGSDGALNDSFGTSVCIKGTDIIVGAPYKNEGKGQAYLFTLQNSEWTEKAILKDEQGTSYAQFGFSVCISGDYAIVGEPYINNGVNVVKGKAFVYNRSGTTWSLQSELTNSYGTSMGNFGNSVLITDKYAVVSSPNESYNSGIVRIYRKDGTNWYEYPELRNNSGIPNFNFGKSISIFDDYLLIGSQLNDGLAEFDTGRVYLYKLDEYYWKLEKQFSNSSPPASNFGSSVGISGSSFIIGSYGFDNYKGKVSFGTMDTF